jgi:flavin reductase (DIM6/NTAB) family NADH-FMN oxidoreductase RutF
VSASATVGGLLEGGRQPLTAHFTAAMSTLASSVVFVTCRLGDRPWGMTVTAFASVSADPPIVLVSLGSTGVTARTIMSSGRFGVSVLAADQLAIARYGSARGATKFLEPFAEPDAGPGASPIVAGALAHLDCELSEHVRIADHTVFFGRVIAARACGGTPLVYHRRGYRRLAEPARAHASTGRNLACPSS